MKKKIRLGMVLVLLFSTIAFFCAPKEALCNPAPPKPNLVTFGVLEVGTSAYVQFAAVAEGIYKTTGIRVRNLPIGSAVAQTLALRTGVAHGSSLSIDLLMAREGLYDFSTLEWGPQPLRLLWQAKKLDPWSMATRADSGIKTFADLKGKRLPNLVGAPSTNLHVQGALAWAGLTVDDVKIIKLHGFAAMYKALLDGTVDAAPVSSISPIVHQIAEGPHGLYWIPMPSDNKEGWERFRQYYPVMNPIRATIGAGLSKEKPIWLASFNYPAIGAYQSTCDENTAYWITKAIVESYDAYKNISPQMQGWHPDLGLKEQLCVYPWHTGSIKYLKEVGLWSERLEKNQKGLVEREKKLSDLWQNVVSEAATQGIKGKDFPKFWLKKRAETFPSYYEPKD